jgi:hypothetical protein
MKPKKMKWECGYQHQDCVDAEQRGYNQALSDYEEWLRSEELIEKVASIIEDKIWGKHEGCIVAPNVYMECPEECCYKYAAQAILEALVGER